MATLTPQELEQARTLRLQGKSTDEVFNYIAGKRINAPSRLSTVRKEPIASEQPSDNLLTDAPQDIFTGVKQLGEGYLNRFDRLKDTAGAALRGEQTFGETATQLSTNIAGGAIADPAFQLAKTGASLFTTPRQEEAIGEAFTQGIQTIDEKSGVVTGVNDWYNGLEPRAQRNVNAALDIIDVLPVGISGKVKSLFRGATKTDPTPKIQEALTRAEQGDTTDAVRVANATLDETTRATEVDNLTRAYQDSLVGDRVKVNRLLQEQANEMSRGDVVITQDDLIRSLANEGVIPDVRGKLADFTQEIRNLDRRQNELFRAYQPVLENTRATASLDEFGTYARKSMSNSRNLRFELDKVDNQLNTVIENLRRAYNLGEGGKLSAKQIDEISREANARSKAYREGGDTFQADVYSELGRAARTWLNENIPDESFRRVNDEWLRLEQVKRTAETMQNQQVDVGILGRALGSYVTTLTGVTLGASVGNPFVAVAAGVLTKLGGDAYADALRSRTFSPEIRKTLQDRLTNDKAIIEKLKQTATTQENKNLFDDISRMLPPGRGDVRSEVGSGAPMRVSPRGEVAPQNDVIETTRPGAINRSDSEAMPTQTETALKMDDIAVQQALMEMEIQVNERPRGSNLAYNTEGETYRFKMLPTWIPKDLRDGDLLDRVMRNISEGKKPRANATNEQQLQEVMEERIKARIEEIKKTEPSNNTSGVFSNDAAFAAALMAGGTYYFMSEDGSMMPVVAVGSMLANPKVARLALKSLDEQRLMMEKSIKVMEDGGQTKTNKYKQTVKALDLLMIEYGKLQKAAGKERG